MAAFLTRACVYFSSFGFFFRESTSGNKMSRKRIGAEARCELQQAWDSRCGGCSRELEWLGLNHLPNDLTCGHYDERCFHVDHLQALQFGGADALWNMWPLCPACHHKKSMLEIKLGVSICPKCHQVVKSHSRVTLHPCIVNHKSVHHFEISDDDADYDRGDDGVRRSDGGVDFTRFELPQPSLRSSSPPLRSLRPSSSR